LRRAEGVGNECVAGLPASVFPDTQAAGFTRNFTMFVLSEAGRFGNFNAQGSPIRRFVFKFAQRFRSKAGRLACCETPNVKRPAFLSLPGSTGKWRRASP
jgi:hypothetical protein